jgi:outer membrane immunogenic protein
MHKVLCASIAALAAMLAPAFAADLSVAPIYNAPSSQAETWGGAYSARFGSGVWGQAKTQDGTTGIASGFDLGGAPVGVTSGLNIQDGKWVLGYESDATVTKKGGEIAPHSAWSSEAKERWLSTYRGRIGVAQDNWLFYATAGGALANIQQNAVSPMSGQTPDARWYWGWAAGAGVEWRVNSDWSAKMEYLYVGLQDKSYFNPAPTAFQNERVRPDDHSLRVGVNYKLPWNVLDSFFASKR